MTNDEAQTLDRAIGAVAGWIGFDWLKRAADMWRQ